MAQENIKENIETSLKEGLVLHELKQQNRWFDQECSRVLEQRLQAKMQWLQDPKRNNVDNLNNVRYGVSRHFRNKKEEISEI